MIPEGTRRAFFNLAAERALTTVHKAFIEAGIAMAPVKGIVLSRWIYDSVEERPFTDVDLLVPRRCAAAAAAVVTDRRWPVYYRSQEMGQLEFYVDDIFVECHSEIGRRHLSNLTVDDVLARSIEDTVTFPFPVRRIDDVDHFLLLVTNIIKDGFAYANQHQPEDLRRFTPLLEHRAGELVARAEAASLLTALRLVVSWVNEVLGSDATRWLFDALPAERRRLFRGAVEWQRRRAPPKDQRLSKAAGLVNYGLAILTPDDLRLRTAGAALLCRRGLARRFGIEPG